MHPDLEALIRAYDTALEAMPQDTVRCREEFEQRLQAVLSGTSGLTEEALRNVVRLAHRPLADCAAEATHAATNCLMSSGRIGFSSERALKRSNSLIVAPPLLNLARP